MRNSTISRSDLAGIIAIIYFVIITATFYNGIMGLANLSHANRLKSMSEDRYEELYNNERDIQEMEAANIEHKLYSKDEMIDRCYKDGTIQSTLSILGLLLVFGAAVELLIESKRNGQNIR